MQYTHLSSLTQTLLLKPEYYFEGSEHKYSFTFLQKYISIVFWKTTRHMLAKGKRLPSSVLPGRPWPSYQPSLDAAFLNTICVPARRQIKPRTQSVHLQSLSRWLLCQWGTFTHMRKWLCFVLLFPLVFFFSMQKVLSECQDERSCQIPALGPVFGHDPCPLTSKYLLVYYKCRPGRWKQVKRCMASYQTLLPWLQEQKLKWFKISCLGAV